MRLALQLALAQLPRCAFSVRERKEAIYIEVTKALLCALSKVKECIMESTDSCLKLMSGDQHILLLAVSR